MTGPDEEPTEKPTNTEAEAAAEGRWMARSWAGVAVVSILILLVLALGLMQVTGLVEVFAPIADTEAGQWGAFAVLALAVAAIAVWGWQAIAASEQ